MNEDNEVIITISISKDLYDELNEQAEGMDMSVEGLIVDKIGG